MKQQWLDDASDDQWESAWVRFVTTPPKTAADAIDGLNQIIDYIDAGDTCLEWIRSDIIRVRKELRSRKPVPTLARDLRLLADRAFEIEPRDDHSLILRTIADGFARPRLVI